MGLVSKILQTLGLDSAQAPPDAPTAVLVDVVAQFEQRTATHPQKLSWRTSIVDLLKLLGLDSSLAARKALAAELGCPEGVAVDSGKLNAWLHKTVLAQVAARGGNVPGELLG